ncbi:histidine triad (HIT) family protein [Roseateles sp. YR242]|uniref:histidine triad nucleotide-binding protein n=1 Tax=Roseateles sp. YR242 TaxID=1855305 RepID=UPI0008BA1E22|nr:histidine triad nucleotide-binding protein [Roseateles sp. YR242]SEK97024.1 histidine triad (HIT) family protein [Roseateles sp. YR242]
MSQDSHCIFCKIVAGQIPAKKAYEDEDLLVFHDIHPWAPVHILLIPKLHIASMAELQPEHAALMGKMTVLVPRLMKELGVTNGFRMVVNTGSDGGQEVHHLHMHAMGGPRPWLKG